ncbi:MAG: hypothetical protein CMJ78_16305 [Planctomycetaceae bacterium]|nr:hypothetical protein [Planctomycetaceae bacterium]
MLDAFKQLTSNQYEAALCMIGLCIKQCPDSHWSEFVASLKFCQAAFHTLFFTDVYLGQNLDELRKQQFHINHAETFGDYEEIGGGLQQALYDKAFVEAYLSHCRQKMTSVLANETDESLNTIADFDWIKFSRAELHVYNIRHIHHHAAQLSLRLRLDHGDGIPWVGTGWRDDLMSA